MPTNEERREVARKLHYVGEHGGPEWETAACCIAECIGEDDYQLWDGSTPIFTKLAELIDPEQERTCHMTKIGGDRVLADWWECSECGPVYPPCNDKIAKWALRKCPHCGAKVVEDD